MSDCCSAPGLMPFEQALSAVLNLVPEPSENMLISLEKALDHVLAEEVISPVNVPPHDNSAMDGYAFSFADLQAGVEEFEIAGRSFAGEPYQGKVPPTACIRIMTGAKMPIGCDTVVMQENTSVVNGKMRLSKAPGCCANVREQGEDIVLGSNVFPAGKKLTAIDIGMLASLGISEVKVYKRLKVALLSTGDELKSPGQPLSEGDIYESNRYALQGLLRRMNVDIVDLGIIADDKQAIRDAFIYANEHADAVISSGGVSVGEADYTKEVLDELGQIDFWKIAMKPGKPFAFGSLPDSVFFGLPGNPVSAVATFYLLASFAIKKMQGLDYQQRMTFKAITQTPLRKHPGRQDFQRAVYHYDELDRAVVRSTGSQGSGILSSIGQANCFIVLPQEQGNVEVGEEVLIQPFDDLLN